MAAPTVHEVTMVMQDMICVEIRETAVDHVGLVEVASPPDAGAYNAWLSRDKTTGGSGSDNALIVGANKDWLKFEDIRASEYLDRDAADVAGDYGTIGGLTVTNVYRKTLPCDWGECKGTSGTITTKAASMRHMLYLKLSGNLAEGTHTIDFPTDTGVVDYEFTFNDKTTRFRGIKANQYGLAPTDLMKFGYIAEWIPGYGTEGQVDYSAISDWHILNANKTIVWSAGAAPALRIGPNDSEPNSGISAPDSRLTSTTTTPRTIVSPGYTNANPVVITYTGDDLTNGMIVRIEGVRADVLGVDTVSALNCISSTVLNHTIANVDNTNPLAKTAELQGVDRSAATATWLSGGLVHQTQATVNRAATYVYGLDFTAFEPEVGATFYIYVEGLGISHPFYIDHASWHNIAANMAAGEYNHRHGIALDGRFGYTRPAGFSPDAHTIYQNLLPYAFSNEIGIHSIGQADALGSIEVCGLTTSPMHTTDTVTYTPGHHDAGDHDSRIGSHSIGYYGFMDFYDQFPDAAEATDWNIPTMEELYPADTTYDGTAVLPECLQQAMFALRDYIAGMTAEGAVRGGINMAAVSTTTPSWLIRSANGSPATTNTVFVYGPDHLAGYMLCALLAKMATCLRKWDDEHSVSTFATLAQYYEDKAVLCWENSEYIWDNGSAWGSGSDGDVDTARTALYGDYRTACESLSAGAFATRFGTVQTFCTSTGRRHSAAAALYKATGEIAYGDIITNSGMDSTTNMANAFGTAAWEYATATHANAVAEKQTTYKSAITNWATGQITDFMYGDIGFKTLKHSTGSASFGADGTDWSEKALPITAAYILSERASPGSGAIYRKAMEDGWHYGLGANLTGKSLVTGVGTEVVTGALHCDSMAQGVALPKGIMVYGPCDRGISSAQSLQSNSPLNWLTQDSTISYTTDFEHERSLDPIHFAWPQHEHFYENPGLIEMTEYVFGGSIAPQQWVAAVLWAGNGELETEFGSGTVSGMALGLQFGI